MNELSAAPGPVTRLIDEFHKLPGIGPKSAQRLTYHLLRIPAADALALANAIIGAEGEDRPLLRLPERHRDGPVRDLQRLCRAIVR